MLAAQGLMQHKRFKEAALLLRPLVASAHGSYQPVAQVLMTAAEAEKLPQPFVFLGSARSFDRPTD